VGCEEPPVVAVAEDGSAAVPLLGAHRGANALARAIAEASGRQPIVRGVLIAASGVDLISAGWLTHSAQVLDIGLDWRHASTGAERSAA